MPRLCMTLLILLVLPLPAWSNELLLFVIQRNKNANEVHYRLQVDDHCHLASNTPVSAVWKLLAEAPEKTAPLTGLERLVYAAVDQHVEGNWVSFHLSPLKERRIKATAISQPGTPPCAPVVHVEMQGQWVALERIYVYADEGLLDPKVLYIDLFGKSVEARLVTERIQP